MAFRHTLLLLAFFLLCAAALGYRSWHERIQDKAFTTLPSEIPGCPSVPIDDLEAWLEQSEAADKRAFLVHGRAFVVSKMSGLAAGGAVHDPAYCARGKGWQIKGTQSVDLPGGVGTRMHLEKGEESLYLLFWFEQDGTAFSSYVEFKLRLLLRRFTFWRQADYPSLYLVQSREAQAPAWQHFQQDVVPWLRLSATHG